MNTWWTVVGYYEDTYQAYAHHVEAVDAYSAMGLIGMRAEAAESLLLVGAIEGRHEMWAPGEENGTVSFAVDMVELSHD